MIPGSRIMELSGRLGRVVSSLHRLELLQKSDLEAGPRADSDDDVRVISLRNKDGDAVSLSLDILVPGLLQDPGKHSMVAGQDTGTSKQRVCHVYDAKIYLIVRVSRVYQFSVSTERVTPIQ